MDTVADIVVCTYPYDYDNDPEIDNFYKFLYETSDNVTACGDREIVEAIYVYDSDEHDQKRAKYIGRSVYPVSTDADGRICIDVSNACDICHEIDRIEQFVCKNGHTACKTCRPRLTECHMCRGNVID